MRIGLGGGGRPPNQIAGYGLIAVGGLIMLMAMPFYFWFTLVGGLVAYLGYSITQYRR